MTTTVAANEDESRYEIVVDDELAGFSEFTAHGDVLTFTHTEVFPEFGGQGLATTLVREALDDVRAKGLRIHATCPFVRAFLQKHPEYQDLIAN